MLVRRAASSLRRGGGFSFPPAAAAAALTCRLNDTRGWEGRGGRLEAGLVAAAAVLAALSCSQSCADCERPLYSRDEVSRHQSPESRMWVSYEGGVYDVTDFVANHPGGASKIKLAIGKDLAPFWRLYGIHKKQEVLDMLEEMRIGDLDAAAQQQEQLDEDDPYAQEPERHPAMRINSEKPFNGEPPPELLVDAGFITPNELYYIRNHLPVPVIDPEEYRLEVIVEGVGSVKLSLEDLKTKFPLYTVVTAIQCAGNRRTEMKKLKEVKGLNWEHGAISNSEWRGVRLRDILAFAGINTNVPPKELQHVQFDGLDADMVTHYGASIPMHKAIDPSGDVLLAFEMNGVPIPRDHGYPVRAVVPGTVGARNVKWLGRVTASAEESSSHWQQRDYKGFSPNVGWDAVPWDSAPAIQDMPVVSAISTPPQGSTVSVYDGSVDVQGYAWSGGGRGIVRVDVSADEGKTWNTAELQPTGQPLHRTWAWTLWKAQVPLPEGVKAGHKVQLLCKATDCAYNVQPENTAPIWNLRGVLSNAWHRIELVVSED
jgi:sulfite oxidase